MIPHVMHRIFLDDPIPAQYEAWWEGLRELHPGWEFKTWSSGEEAREWLWNGHLWDKVNPMAGRTDLLRYEIIAREGGVYVDTDIQGFKSLDPLCEDDRPFVGWESPDRLCPTVIGSPPDHYCSKELVQGLRSWVESHLSEKDPVIQTGPIYLTQAWQFKREVRRLPMSYFYGVGPTERKLLKRFTPTPDTYLLHHWTKGWAKTV